MNRSLQAIRNFLRREDGPTAVEYAVMLALIIAACLGAVTAMANATAANFDESASQLAAAFGA